MADSPSIRNFEKIANPPEVLIVDQHKPRDNRVENKDAAYVFTAFDGHEVGEKLTRQELAAYLTKYHSQPPNRKGKGLDTSYYYADSLERAQEAFGVELREEAPPKGETRVAYDPSKLQAYRHHGKSYAVYKENILQGYMLVEAPLLYELAESLTVILDVPNAIVPEFSISSQAEALMQSKDLTLNDYGQLIDASENIVHDFNKTKGPSGELRNATHVIIAADENGLKVISRTDDAHDAGSVVNHVKI